jgi:hypothetical protein
LGDVVIGFAVIKVHRIIRVLELKERTYYHRKSREKTEKKKKSSGRPHKRYCEVVGLYS